jgi:two-component system chemotaxis response regulator CheY
MRVLIVDDSRFLRERLKALLPAGCAVEEVGDGEEALAKLRTSAAFDLVLLDVNMPVMGGLECVRLLREQALAPTAKVMMVTTEADSSFISQALDDGADEFLMKPVSAESFEAKLLMLGLRKRSAPPLPMKVRAAA